MSTYLRIRQGDKIRTLPLTISGDRERPTLTGPDGETWDGKMFAALPHAEIISDNAGLVCRSLGMSLGEPGVVDASDLDEEELCLIGLHPWGDVTEPVEHRAHADSRI